MDEEDLLMVLEVARETRRFAWDVRECYRGRMDRKEVPWNRAADLVSASQTAAWCIGWLVAEVRRLEGEVRAERARVESPYVRILRQVRSLERK